MLELESSTWCLYLPAGLGSVVDNMLAGKELDTFHSLITTGLHFMMYKDGDFLQLPIMVNKRIIRAPNKGDTSKGLACTLLVSVVMNMA